MKKSSPDTLLLDKGSSKDFLVEISGIEPLIEALRASISVADHGLK